MLLWSLSLADRPEEAHRHIIGNSGVQLANIGLTTWTFSLLPWKPPGILSRGEKEGGESGDPAC